MFAVTNNVAIAHNTVCVYASVSVEQIPKTGILVKRVCALIIRTDITKLPFIEVLPIYTCLLYTSDAADE